MSFVIFAPASPQVEGARKATKTIPIVFAAHGDPRLQPRYLNTMEVYCGKHISDCADDCSGVRYG